MLISRIRKVKSTRKYLQKITLQKKYELLYKNTIENEPLKYIYIFKYFYKYFYSNKCNW